MFLQEVSVAAFLGFEDHDREASPQANFVGPANLGGSGNNCRYYGADGSLSSLMRQKNNRNQVIFVHMVEERSAQIPKLSGGKMPEA